MLERVTEEHPDIHAILLDSGIQRQFDFTKPESVGMDAVMEETRTNYISPVAMTKAFLPFLRSKDTDTALMYTSSGLALVAMPHSPNYCGTKAALHAFLSGVRAQLERAAPKLKIIEFFPPLIATELHDSNTHDNTAATRSARDKRALPVQSYTDAAIEGLAAGQVEIPVGTAVAWYEVIELPRKEIQEKAAARRKLAG